MRPLLDAAAEVTRWLEEEEIPACVIGGLAVERWGEPRLTQDVDLTILAPYGDEDPIIDKCLKKFVPRNADARKFALDHRVLLLTASNGVELDLALGGSGFETGSIERSTPYEFDAGYVMRTCSAEDLIIHKAVAGRPRDHDDIEGVIHRHWRALDVEHIRRWLAVFEELKEDSTLLTTFERMLAAANKQKPGR
jgi:predicted nucleotidyltransferase